MGDPYSISALIISGLTAIGTVMVHYNCKHCKSGCCESDCFPQDHPQTTVNFSRSTSPIMIQDWQPRADLPLSRVDGQAQAGQPGHTGFLLSFDRDGSPKLTPASEGARYVKREGREGSPITDGSTSTESPLLKRHTAVVEPGRALIDEVIELHRHVRNSSPLIDTNYLCEDIKL